MPGFTKIAIKKSFMKLLNLRPINQITVKDIVEDCGINRNSFYYHFSDIPALVEEIVTDEADRIIAEYPAIDSIEECFNAAVRFVIDNKKAVYHIYNSANRDIFVRYLLDICQYVASNYINTVFKETDVMEGDKELIIRFYKCELFGSVIEWLNTGMKLDICAAFSRLCLLRKGMAEEMFKRSAEIKRERAGRIKK